jgi:hypothetical protein
MSHCLKVRRSCFVVVVEEAILESDHSSFAGLGSCKHVSMESVAARFRVRKWHKTGITSRRQTIYGERLLKSKIIAALIAAALLSPFANAAPPNFHTSSCPVKLDSVRLGTDLTPGGASLRNTIIYDESAKLFHFWGFDDDASSTLGQIKHATSTDGLHFTSDTFLTYGIGSVNYADFGATIDPPLDFFRAAFDTDSGTWKLFNWSENDSSNPSRWGQYNYNTSVNDLGTLPGNTSVVHQGPLSSPFSGNHVGTFGLVDGNIYLRVDSAGPSGGGNAKLPYTDGLPPSAGAESSEANLFTGTPYCWLVDPNCGASDPRIPSYVHNVGRTLRQSDGTLGTYYTFRRADASRLDKQIWYVESNDNGATWSAPAGVFADGSLLSIDGSPIDSSVGEGNFSSVDVVQATNQCRVYLSTQDASGNFVMVSSSTGSACDAIFADSFEGCGD